MPDKKMVNPHVKIMTMRISVQDGTEYSLECRWSVSKKMNQVRQFTRLRGMPRSTILAVILFRAIPFISP